MAKKAPPKMPTRTTKKSVSLPPGWFVNIYSEELDDSGDCTIDAVVRVPAGQNGTVAVTYIDVNDDTSTGSVDPPPTIGANNQVEATITLPGESTYIVTIWLMDGNGNVKASDSVIVSTD
jgi:hypothetical protein